MKAFALISLLLATLLPAAAYAQQAAPERPDPRNGGRPDPERMRQVLDERFRKADANADGVLSRAEAEAGMPMLLRDFDRIDANGDGNVSPAELHAAMERRHAALKSAAGADAPGRAHDFDGGRPTPEAIKARVEQMFRRADSDGDGVLTEDEAARVSPRLAQQFAAIDANHDGKLSREEIEQFRQSRFREMEARRAAGAHGAPGEAAK